MMEIEVEVEVEMDRERERNIIVRLRRSRSDISRFSNAHYAHPVFNFTKMFHFQVTAKRTSNQWNGYATQYRVTRHYIPCSEKKESWSSAHLGVHLHLVTPRVIAVRCVTTQPHLWTHAQIIGDSNWDTKLVWMWKGQRLQVRMLLIFLNFKSHVVMILYLSGLNMMAPILNNGSMVGAKTKKPY